jgi:hypothetical protein
MLGVDVFNTDAFSAVEMTAALEKVPYVPGWLGQIGLFDPYPIRTETFAVEKRDNVLSLVQTTERGSPIPNRGRERRDIRDFRTVRVANGDVLRASEIQNIRAFGQETELEQLQTEVLRRELAVRNDLELTHENMRIGAIQGIVLDADGSTIRNWFTEWGVTAATEINFDLGAASTGSVRTNCQKVIRAMKRNAKGAWVPNVTQVIGLCSDLFYDSLIANKEVRETYLNWNEAEQLRGETAFGMFRYGGIWWMNYQGTDDNTTVAVAAGKCKFFPWKGRDIFQKVMSPGESFDWVNTPGQDWYSRSIPDTKRNEFVEIEVMSYPQYVCLRPEMLQSGDDGIT